MKKYYIRCVKITKTKNKNMDNLMFCYTGDEYERLNFEGTYNGQNRYQCLNTFSHCLYKYTENYFETENIIICDTKIPFILRDEPDFLSFFGRNNNVLISCHKYGEELTIGLYCKDDITNKYIFMRNSDYDEKKQMFILVQ